MLISRVFELLGNRADASVLANLPIGDYIEPPLIIASRAAIRSATDCEDLRFLSRYSATIDVLLANGGNMHLSNPNYPRYNLKRYAVQLFTKLDKKGRDDGGDWASPHVKGGQNRQIAHQPPCVPNRRPI